MEVAETSDDTGAIQALKALDSIESKTEQLKVSYQQLYTSMGAEEWAKSFLDVARTVMDNLNRMPKAFGKFPLAALDMLGNMIVLVKPLVSKLTDWLRNEFVEGGKEAGQGMSEGIKEGMAGASADTSEQAKALAERNKLAQGATTRDALGYIFGKKGTITEKVVAKDKQAAEDAKKNAEAQAETATAMSTAAEAAQNTAKANEEVGDSAENAAKKAQEQAQALKNQANASTSVDTGASAAEGAIRDVANASDEAAEAAKRQAQETKNLNEALSETPTATNTTTAPAGTNKNPKTRRRAIAQAQKMTGKDTKATEEVAQETIALNENANAARNAAEAREALNNAEALATTTTQENTQANNNSTLSIEEQIQAETEHITKIKEAIAAKGQMLGMASRSGNTSVIEGYKAEVDNLKVSLEEAKQRLAQLQAQMGNTGAGTVPAATPTGNGQQPTAQPQPQSPVPPETAGNLDRAGVAAEGFGHRLINAYNASSALGSSITSIGMAIKLFTTLIDTSTVSGKKWAGSIIFIGSAIMAVNTAIRIVAATAKGLVISGGLWFAIASGIIGMINGIATFVETTSEKIERLTKEAEELKNIRLEVKDTEKNLTSGINKVKELEEARYESAEATEEYQTTVDQLADAFPELISGFDGANNIMIDITNAEEVLALARKKTLQATLDAAEGEIKKNEEEIEGVKDNIRTNASIFNGTNVEEGYLSTGYDIFQELLVTSVEQEQSDEIMKMVAGLSQESDFSDFEKVYEKVHEIFTPEKISNLDDTAKRAYDDLFGANGYITLIKEGYAQIEALDKANQGYAKSAISADLNNRDKKYNEESKYLNRLGAAFIQKKYEAAREEDETLLYETWREGQEELFNTTSENLQSFWDSMTVEGQSDFDRMMGSKETYSAQAFYDKFGITDSNDPIYQAIEDMYKKDAENIQTRMLNNIQGGSDKEEPAEGTNLSKLYRMASELEGQFITIYTESIVSQATSTINNLESHGLFNAASNYVDNIIGIFDLVKEAFEGDAYGADNFIKQLSSYDLNSQEGIDNAIAYIESLPNAENYTGIVNQLKTLQEVIVSDLTSEIDAIKSNIQGSFDNALKNIDKATKGVDLSDAMEVFDQISAVLGEKLDFNELFTQDPNELGKYILKDADKINEVYDKLAEEVGLRVKNLRETLDEAEQQVFFNDDRQENKLKNKLSQATGAYAFYKIHFEDLGYDNAYEAFTAESLFAQTNSEFLEALEELNLTTAFQEYLESGNFDKFKKAVDEAIAGKEADYTGVEAYLNELETIQPAMMQAAAGNITEAIRQIWQLAIDATENDTTKENLASLFGESDSVWTLFGEGGAEKLKALRQADAANGTNYYSNVITMMEQASTSMNNFWKDILSQGWDKAFNNLASYNLDSSLEEQINNFKWSNVDGYVNFFNQFATSMGLVAGTADYFSAYASALEADNKQSDYNRNEAIKALKYTQNAEDAYYEATVDQMTALAEAYGIKDISEFDSLYDDVTGTYHLTENDLKGLGINNKTYLSQVKSASDEQISSDLQSVFSTIVDKSWERAKEELYKYDSLKGFNLGAKTMNAQGFLLTMKDQLNLTTEEFNEQMLKAMEADNKQALKQSDVSEAVQSVKIIGEGINEVWLLEGEQLKTLADYHDSDVNDLYEAIDETGKYILSDEGKSLVLRNKRDYEVAIKNSQEQVEQDFESWFTTLIENGVEGIDKSWAALNEYDSLRQFDWSEVEGLLKEEGRFSAQEILNIIMSQMDLTIEEQNEKILEAFKLDNKSDVQMAEARGVVEGLEAVKDGRANLLVATEDEVKNLASLLGVSVNEIVTCYNKETDKFILNHHTLGQMGLGSEIETAIAQSAENLQSDVTSLFTDIVELGYDEAIKSLYKYDTLKDTDIEEVIKSDMSDFEIFKALTEVLGDSLDFRDFNDLFTLLQSNTEAYKKKIKKSIKVAQNSNGEAVVFGSFDEVVALANAYKVSVKDLITGYNEELDEYIIDATKEVDGEAIFSESELKQGFEDFKVSFTEDISNFIDSALSDGLDYAKAHLNDYENLKTFDISGFNNASDLVLAMRSMYGNDRLGTQQFNADYIKALQDSSGGLRRDARDNAVRDLTIVSKELGYATYEQAQALADAYGIDVNTIVGNYNRELQKYMIDLSNPAIANDNASIITEAINTLYETIADSIVSAIDGSLSLDDFTLLKGYFKDATNFDLDESQFTRTADGLKISVGYGRELYTVISKVDKIAGEIILDQLVESVQETTAEYNDIYLVSKKIEEVEKEIRSLNETTSSARKNQLEGELAVLKKINQELAKAGDYNFMDRDLPDSFNAPMSAMEGFDSAITFIKSSEFKKGKVDPTDFYNLITTLDAMGVQAKDIGVKTSSNISSMSDLINRAFETLTYIDGKPILNLSKLGDEFQASASGMSSGIEGGLHDLAEDQIAMLDAAIQMLDTIAAFEDLSVDVDGNGIFNFADIFGNVNPNEANEFSDKWTAQRKEWKEALENAGVELDSITIAGVTLGELLTKEWSELKAKIDPQTYFSIFENFSKLSAEDYNPEDIASIFKTLGDGLERAVMISDSEFKKTIAISPSGIEFEIDWESDTIKDLGIKTEEDKKAWIEKIEKYLNGEGNKEDFLTINKILGIATNYTDDDGSIHYLFNGKDLGTGEEAEALQRLLSEELGADWDLSSWNIDGGEGTATITYNGLDTTIELKKVNGKLQYVVNGTTYTDKVEADKAAAKLIMIESASEKDSEIDLSDESEYSDIRAFIGENGITFEYITNGEKAITTYKGKTFTGKNQAELYQQIIEYEKQLSSGITIPTIDADPLEIDVDGKTYTVYTYSDGTKVWVDEETGEMLTKEQFEALQKKNTLEATRKLEGKKTTTDVSTGEITISPISIQLSDGSLVEGKLQLSNSVPVEVSASELSVDISGATPSLASGGEGETSTTTSEPVDVGSIGEVKGTASGLSIALPAETQITTTDTENMPTEYTLPDELVPIIKGNAGTVTITVAQGAIDVDTPETIDAGTIEGTVTGTAQTALINATTYQVTFAAEDGKTTQTITVDGTANLTGLINSIAGATKGEDGWKIQFDDSQFDVAIENLALIQQQIADLVKPEDKTITVSYTTPDGEPQLNPGNGNSNFGIYNWVTGLLQGNKNYDTLEAAISDAEIQMTNGVLNNGSFSIVQLDGSGTITATLTGVSQFKAKNTAITANAVTITATGGNGNDNGGGTGKGGKTGGGQTGGSVGISFNTSGITNAFKDVETAAQKAGDKLATAATKFDTITDSTDSLSRFGSMVNSVGSNASNKSSAVSGLASSIAKLPTSKKNVGIAYKLTVTAIGKGVGLPQVKGSISNITGDTGGSSYSQNSVSTTLAKGSNPRKRPACAKGKRRTLMGELGPELVVSDGSYFIAGQNGAEFVNLKDDAIVFNHIQTKRLLSQGFSGRGVPITNETNAVAFATGNLGPAKASASEAADELRKVRALWQALLNASASDLGKKAGSGGGGGGGGKDLAAQIHDLNRWYNLLRQIEKYEQKITYEQQKRANLQNGYKYADSLERELAYLKKQQDAYQMLADLQKDYYDRRRQDLLSTDYAKIFTYDEDGLMQYVDGVNRGLDILAKLNETDATGRPINNAVDSAAQIRYLQSVGFNTSSLETNDDGTKAENQDEMMKNFWARIDSWMEELDGLYDDYNDHLTDVEKNTAAQTKILQEFVDNQLSAQNKLLKAIEDREQAVIDKLEEEKQAIEDANNDYIDGLTEALNKERNLYDNSQDEIETKRLQAQLAILKRTNASASEIASMQEQVDSRLKDDYFNKMQEQIDAIQEASDKQIEKLEKQIDLAKEALEYQKENGLFWEEIGQMLNEWTPEKLLEFVETYTKSYRSDSNLKNDEESKKTLKEFEIEKARQQESQRNSDWNDYINSLAGYSEDLINKNKLAAENAYKDAYSEGGKTGAESAANKIFEDALKAEEDKKKAEEDAKNNPTQPTTPETPKSDYDGEVTGGSVNLRDKKNGNIITVIHRGDKFEYLDKDGSWWKIKVNGRTGWAASKYLTRYANGGLVDFTGPAYVDGTPSKPEAFLNAEQTKLFKEQIFSNSKYSLVGAIEALNNLRSNIGNSSVVPQSSIDMSGMTIKLETGTISNDYDARRAGQQIFDEMVKMARKTGTMTIKGR